MKVLSVFDQSRKDGKNNQVLRIEENDYANDDEMKHILHRLLSAASDAKLRQDMNVEDEYFSAIENRDTAIMQRDKKIEEQEAQIEANKVQLEEKEAQLEANKAQLEAKDAQLEEHKARLETQRNFLKASVKIMKESGIPIENIAKQTGLSLDDIKSLLN